jgi:crotonobetainyl-CoA:carnitine CoA-transferase CaiB-like acyl-CoA transferase
MGALAGLKVLDLSRVLAGPWCGQILADLGAVVIKIERPGTGDDTRGWGPPWMKDTAGGTTREASYFQSANRGKQSLAVDIATRDGQAIIRALADKSDVVIENYKVGALSKYGLDYETLSKTNPRLVYCSITGFGQSGPRASEPGYDFIVQGIGGLMSITGEADDRPGGGPQKVGVAVADLMTGLYATIAIEAALLARQRTGKGQHCDLALLDVQVAALCNQAMNYLESGRTPKRYGNAHANIVPYQVFRARDADFVVACGNDSQFAAFCTAIGLPDLIVDPRFVRNQDRVVHRDELGPILADRFIEAPAQEWITKIHAAGVPVGRINSIAQALDEPQVLAREMLVDIPHPKNEKFRMVGSPLKLSDTPVRYGAPPPMLGEHTYAILRESLGLTEADLERLSSGGVVEQLGVGRAAGAAAE